MVAESPGWALLHGFEARVDQTPQAGVAAVGILVGGIVANHGCILVKPLFVTTCAAYFAFQAFVLCHEATNHNLYVWAPGVSVAVGLLSLKLWHWAYPGFLFLVGCALGGGSVFVAFTELVVRKDPASLLGATVLGALLAGLSFVRFHNVYWRLLLPPAGGLLAAAGLRYYAAALATADARWTQFTRDLVSGSAAILSTSGAVFWTSWAVLALLGWYLQMAPYFGLRQPQALVPEWASSRCPWLLGPEGILGSGVPSQASSSSKLWARKLPQLPGSLEPSGEPLLRADDTDLQGNLLPELSLKQVMEASDQIMQTDLRPEVALLVAVTSVMCLNWLLKEQPILFLGHAVLMSAAFLVLTTAGMVSYASKNLFLPHFFGPLRNSKLPRHFTHATFNGLAMACALGGYACIYASHQQAGASQFGLEKGNSWGRKLHVWIGYLVLVLMLVQAFSGIIKLYAAALFGAHRMRFHHALGRAMYCLAAANQLVAYTFPGLFPTWATPVLASMLIITVGATLFFLEEKNRMVVTKARLEEARLHLEEQLSNRSGNTIVAKETSNFSGTACSTAPPAMPSRESSTAAFEAAVLALRRASGRFLLQKVVTEWSRILQQKRLHDTAILLEGQERLVDFLSQELVDGVATSRRSGPDEYGESETSHQSSTRS